MTPTTTKPRNVAVGGAGIPSGIGPTFSSISTTGKEDGHGPRSHDASASRAGYLNDRRRRRPSLGRGAEMAPLAFNSCVPPAEANAESGGLVGGTRHLSIFAPCGRSTGRARNAQTSGDRPVATPRTGTIDPVWSALWRSKAGEVSRETNRPLPNLSPQGDVSAAAWKDTRSTADRHTGVRGDTSVAIDGSGAKPDSVSSRLSTRPALTLLPLSGAYRLSRRTRGAAASSRSAAPPLFCAGSPPVQPPARHPSRANSAARLPSNVHGRGSGRYFL